jgi:hypothetical protein
VLDCLTDDLEIAGDGIEGLFVAKEFVKGVALDE